MVLLIFRGSIQGIDAHGARPHQGKNAIDVIMAVQQMLHSIHLSPFEPHSAKLTLRIIADGTNTNYSQEMLVSQWMFAHSTINNLNCCAVKLNLA